MTRRQDLARLRAAEDRIEACFRVVAQLAIELEGAGVRLPRETLPVVDAIMTGRGCARRPVPSRRERWLQFWWHLHGELTHYVFYVLIGDAILGRYAPPGMRRAAWVDGFNAAFSGGQHRPLSLMAEHADGNEAGWEVRSREYEDGIMPEREERPQDVAVLLAAFEDEDGVIWI